MLVLEYEEHEEYASLMNNMLSYEEYARFYLKFCHEDIKGLKDK